jgi:hypothetical protein
MSERIRRRPRSSLIAAVLALACGGCCGGGDSEGTGSVSLTNATPYFVHFLHPDQTVLYVEPGETVGVEVSHSEAFTILIAPGQDEKGLVEDAAPCCVENPDADDKTLLCASVTANFNAGGLSANVTVPSCPASGGSCPYVYSGIGDVLEGESLVGALNRGAVRHDVMVLSRLAPEDGSYRVRVATELDETDYVDAVWLELLDHPTGSRVVKDSKGILHVFNESRAARRSVDAGGRELGQALDADDDAQWEGRDREHTLDGKIRDWVELSFARPAAAKRALLLVRGRNTRLLQDAYHEYIASFGPGMSKLMRFMTSLSSYRPQLENYLEESGFSLDVALRVDGAWRATDPVRPVGPAGAQTIAVPLELPAQASEEVRVRLAMLPGAWILDSARISFDATTSVASRRLEATSALRTPGDVGQPSAAALAAIAANDESTLRLETGESLVLRFAEPSKMNGSAGHDRTAVLHVVGYYEENDRSTGRCVNWKRLFAASRQDNSFARHVLDRLSFQDVVDRYAEETGIRSPR